MMRYVKLGISTCLIGIISLYALSMPIIAYSLIDLLQNQSFILQSHALDKSSGEDLIVVLGGGSDVEPEYGNQRSPSDMTRNRIRYAAYLHRKTHLPILVSGGRPLPVLDSEATLMANVLRDDYQIFNTLKEEESQNTAEESRHVATILQQHHFSHIYLVTNAWHMPRSVYSFRCAGIKLTPAPMGFYVYHSGYGLISYIPSIRALSASTIAIHEWIGLLWYRLRDEKTCAISP